MFSKAGDPPECHADVAASHLAVQFPDLTEFS